MSAEANKAILLEGARAFNDQKDRSGWIGIHDPNVVAHGLTPETLDRDGLEQFYQVLWKAFPDLRIAVDDLIGEGDRVAWRLTVQGTHEAEFRGVPPTGRQVVFAAQYIFRFRDGRVVERWTNFDRLGVLIQIGAVPSPV
ncbi:MAG TPA: ester cyclase [Gemmatimonadota bacterium]|nr:ester cyclase [Gemmatimonadota bacterium]